MAFLRRWLQGMVWFWSEFRRNRGGMIGLGILTFFIVLALAAPLLTPYDPLRDVNVARTFAPPSWVRIVPAYRGVPPSLAHVFAYEDWQGTEGVTLSMPRVEGEPVTVASGVRTVDRVREFAVEVEGVGEHTLWAQPFAYHYDPPRMFRLSFRYRLERLEGARVELAANLIAPDGEHYQIWEAPRAFTEADGRRREAVADTRDTPLKRALGFSPFVTLAHELMREHGDYVIQIIARLQPHGEEDKEPHLRLGLSEPVMWIPGTVFGVLGTDHRGSDLFAQLAYGARISLMIGIAAALIGVFIGVIIGLLAGYLGGVVDEVLMRFTDVFISLPTLPILLILAALLGKSIWNIVLLVGLLGWMGAARIVRSQTLSLKERGFVESTKAIGGRETYVMARHILPNVLPLLFAVLVLSIPTAIIAEATLSFLGFGDPRLPTWGRMLHAARGFGAFPRLAWWWILPPGIAITLLSLSFVFVGNAVDRIVNPKFRER